MTEALEAYYRKRDFKITSEPRGGSASAGALAFVVQKHAATRLHYDFRLELDGTLKSWAVPKGPSLDPADKRMAVHVEDHPLDYGSFEGTIPKGQYGAGEVIVWDNGSWEPIGDARAGYAAGKLKFRLHGHKLAGGWTLVRMHGRAGERQEPWLLIKERDELARPAAEYDVVVAEPGSVLSDRTIADKPPAAPAEAAADDSKKPVAPAKPARAAASPVAVAEKPARKTARKAARPASAAPSAIEIGVAAALPETLAPELATLVTQAPAEEGWIYEIKFDGYRLLARIDGDDVRLLTRNGNDWSDRLPGLVAAVRGLGLGSGWLDGEIVVAGANGAPDFNALQNAFDSSRTDSILYYLFDLPFQGGRDLRQVPLVQRRARLAGLLEAAPASARIRFSEDFHAPPEELLNNACRMRLEGVIGKRADSPYVSKRSPSWIKLKCTQRQEFVVGGFTDPKGARTGLGSLLLGIHDEVGELRYAGSVGSGFDEKTLSAVRKALATIGSDATPFTPKPRGVKAHWVRPSLVAEVSFSEWTPDGLVRHPVFHGLREDKDPAGIVRERAAPAKQVAAAAEQEHAAAEPKPAGPAARPARATGGAVKRPSGPAAAAAGGIRISHPERVVDASTGITKLDVVNYYLEAARLILPHLGGRPVSLVRAPAGIGGHLFFQRHAAALKIPELKRLDPAISPDHEPMVEIDSFAALIGSAQNNVIELHTWNATTRSIGRPDRLVFDLDPGEGVAWGKIQEGAELMRSLLEQLGLVAFLKTSGGKGLHVVVPIVPKEDWDEAKAFSKAVVEHMAAVIPDRFVAKSGPKNRVGRIFVDYLRNGFGATTACAWSARARPGLGVSVPCAWSELGGLSGGDHWHLRNVHERIEERTDPWAGYARTRQALAAARKRLETAAG